MSNTPKGKQGRDWNCQDPAKRMAWVVAMTGALRVLEGKWKIVIICQLFAAKRPLRLSELQRQIEGINQKMLIQQLKELERDGIVLRTAYPEVPPRVEYELTTLGCGLGPSLGALVDWADLRDQLAASDASRP